MYTTTGAVILPEQTWQRIQMSIVFLMNGQEHSRSKPREELKELSRDDRFFKDAAKSMRIMAE